MFDILGAILAGNDNKTSAAAFFDPMDLGGVRQQDAQERANQMNIQLAKDMMAFQERMSSTAHQRAMADLQKAGLNPILAAKSPASTPTGAQATVSPENQQAKAMSELPGKVMGVMSGGLSAAATAQDIAVKKAAEANTVANTANIQADTAGKIIENVEKDASADFAQKRKKIHDVIVKQEHSAKEAETLQNEISKGSFAKYLKWIKNNVGIDFGVKFGVGGSAKSKVKPGGVTHKGLPNKM